jgi:hypothetical protein
MEHGNTNKERPAEPVTQLEAYKLDTLLETHAKANGFPTSYYMAMASRETNCINELGDFQNDEYHGVGIVQIDIQHEIAREARDSGSWKSNAEPLIEFGAKLLSDNIAAARDEFGNVAREQHLKIAASGYNCGMRRAIRAAHDGDSDKFTTNKDYGRYVMTRMAIFDELIAESN